MPTSSPAITYLRNVPGFRSGRPWRVIFASFWYLALLVNVITEVAERDLSALLAAPLALAFSAGLFALGGSALDRDWSALLGDGARRARKGAEPAAQELRRRLDVRRADIEAKRAGNTATQTEKEKEKEEILPTATPTPEPAARSLTEAGPIAVPEPLATPIQAEPLDSPAPRETVPWTGGPVLDWRSAERLVMAWMQAHGFDDVSLTVGGADGGVDVMARGACAQVKLFSGTAVSRPEVQKIFGVARAQNREPLFFAESTAGYTRDAREWATTYGVALFTFTRHGTVDPLNTHATEISQRAMPVVEVVRAGLRHEAKFARAQELRKRKEFDRQFRALTASWSTRRSKDNKDALYRLLRPGETLRALAGWESGNGLLAATDQRLISLETVGQGLERREWTPHQIRAVTTTGDGPMLRTLQITIGARTLEYRGWAKEIDALVSAIDQLRSSIQLHPPAP